MFFCPFIFRRFMWVCCVCVNSMLLNVIPFSKQNQIPEEGLRTFNSGCVCTLKPENALWVVLPFDPHLPCPSFL